MHDGMHLCLHHMQVCVSQCPTANEFGVRNGPICVDEVNTTRFTNISVDLTNPSSIITTSSNVAVSECLDYMCAHVRGGGTVVSEASFKLISECDINSRHLTCNYQQ